VNAPGATPEKENPFCTRRVRPGAIAYLFPEGMDAQRLVARLAANGWRGQIVGPHGSGKSTLLAALVPELQRAGRKVLQIRLHDGQRRLPIDWSRAEVGPATVVIVDGYEQLGLLSRWRLKRQCRRRRAGLLVASHAPVGLPVLFRTEVTPAQAEAIVALLLAGGDAPPPPDVLAACLSRHRGNLREVLFELYDQYAS